MGPSSYTVCMHSASVASPMRLIRTIVGSAVEASGFGSPDAEVTDRNRMPVTAKSNEDQANNSIFT